MLQGVADRGQRVAQLVGQGRQELVLAAVGFGQVAAADCRSVVFRRLRSVMSVPVGARNKTRPASSLMGSRMKSTTR